jgi:peroxidase
MIEENTSSPALNSPSFKAQRAVSTNFAARMAAKRGYVEDHGTQYLAKKFGYRREFHKRSNIGKGPKTNLIVEKEIDCNFFTRYRTSDGSCNNRKKSKWGSGMMPFRRIMNPDYCDGISAPRCAIDGSELASARQISTQIHRPSYATEQNFTVMLAVWGQFLDHDITATALSQSNF